MNITSINGVNTGIQQGMNMQTDSVTKSIQNQIADAQKELQDLSADAEMSIEDKMKKRQEIQQEIVNLNQQLRQHQMEQRKEKQQKATSMDDILGGTHKSNTVKKNGQGKQIMSQATMTAMISADSSMKQAQVQGAMATKMEGKAGVLESEIKMDKSRGGNTEAKEAELADLQERIQTTTASQISTLADAGKTMEEAAKADQVTGEAEKNADKTEGKSDKNTENKADGVTSDENATESVSVENSEVSVEQVSTAQTASQSASHVSVDIRL
ncbi:MAG: FlxA-like family protein [Clostridiales bacterium]|nr:FlxA-like family protein [Clostridiales bacterium]